MVECQVTNPAGKDASVHNEFHLLGTPYASWWIKEGNFPLVTMTSDGIFLVIPTHLHHDIALRGHVGRTRCFGESLPWGGGIQVLSPASCLAMRWDRGESNPGRPLQEVSSSDHWLAPLWEIPFSCTEHSLHPRFPLIETQKEKCQAIEFKQKGLRQLISLRQLCSLYL